MTPEQNHRIVPSDWNSCNLSEICSYAKRNRNATALDSAIYISTENMVSDRGGIKDLLENAPATGFQFFEKNDVLVSNIRPYLKKIWKADFSGKCSTDILVFHATENVAVDYLYQSLSADTFFDYCMTTAKGTKMPRGDKNEIMNYVMPIPPLAEQQKIARILCAQDSVIALKQKLLQEKQRQKKYLLRKLLSQDGGQFTLCGVTIDKHGWKKTRLGDICKFVGGGTPTTKNTTYWNGSIPWISSSDLIQDDVLHVNISRYITADAIENSATHLCPKDSILIVTRVGVGKIAIAPVALCTSQDFLNIIEITADKVFVLYKLYFHLQDLTNDVQGTAIKGITTDKVKDLFVSLPTLPEQHVIARVLSAADKELELLQKSIAQEKQKKKALMQLLLTGTVRVKT